LLLLCIRYVLTPSFPVWHSQEVATGRGIDRMDAERTSFTGGYSQSGDTEKGLIRGLLNRATTNTHRNTRIGYTIKFVYPIKVTQCDYEVTQCNYGGSIQWPVLNPSVAPQ